jgi:hypothetical protein
MLRGGFPRSHLAPGDVASLGWREEVGAAPAMTKSMHIALSDLEPTSNC